MLNLYTQKKPKRFVSAFTFQKEYFIFLKAIHYNRLIHLQSFLRH